MAGRPRFDPSTKDRDTVRAMSAAGHLQSEIAAVIGVDLKTLRKHFRMELDLAHIQANAAVASKLYQMAMAGNLGACIFWLKARAGWRDNDEAKVGIGVNIEVTSNDPITSLRSRVAGILERERAGGILPITDAGRTGTD